MEFWGLGSYVTPLIVTAIIIVLTYVYLTRNFGFWRDRGIPGPPPSPLIGTIGGFFKMDALTFDRENYRKYGRVYGEFVGAYPQLMIADPVILREILVKEFSNFADRSQDNVGTIKGEYGARKMLTILTGDEWKRVRNTLTPAFTASRFRLMVSRINECTDILMENLRKKADDVDVKRSTDCFTFDVIARVGFGVELDSQKDPDSPFIKNARVIFSNQGGLKRKLRVMMFIIPGLFRFLKFFNPKLSVFPGNTGTFFLNLVERVIKQRNESNQQNEGNQQDLIQLMLDAHKLENTSEDTETDDVTKAETSTGAINRKALTKEEVMGQSLLLLIAGFETTSSTICFLLYNFAVNPECQEKARQEVDQILGDKKKVSYDLSHQFPYLEMCISESLRLFPPATRTNRHCLKDITINGVDIPGGTTVNAAIGILHYDEKVWPEPYKFIPERFTPEEKAKRDSFNYMPFGMGQRNCIGMRLAQTEIRIAVAKILQSFIIKPNSKTKIPLELAVGGLVTPKEGIFLQLQPRE